VATICYVAADLIGYNVVPLILLMTASVLAMLFDILPVLTAAALSAFIWNFFFIPPLYTLHISTASDLLMFLLYFIIAMLNAVLTAKIREAEKKARDKEEKEHTIVLYNTLLNSLSHELRTPISTIMGSVDTLKEQSDKLSELQQSQLLNEINLASLRLNRQVENLLNMSRLESGMLKPKLDWCDLHELIYSVIAKVPTFHHDIQYTANESLPLIKMDHGLMEQVLYNLLHNAVHYTPAGSSIYVSAFMQGSECIVKIKDQGPGFSGEELQHAFDKFYRGAEAGSGGSGLGLSIVKGFVEALQGHITLENNPEGGACFTLSLPVETTFINKLKNE